MAKADTDYRPRLEQLTQPDIDAQEVLDRLDELNDRSTPTRQGYLFSIAGKKARLFDLNNTEILVRAENLEHYIDKGFTVKESSKTEEGGTKKAKLDDLGMGRLHDVVPVLTQAGTEPVIRQVEEQKEADAAKAEADEAKAKAAAKKKADDAKAKADADAAAKLADANPAVTGGFTSIGSTPPAGESKP